MNGWIKLHRKFQEWEWYRDSRMVHLFIHLLIKANREPGEWKGIKVARGQLITGRKQLSKETGISERSIRTCIERLKTTSELSLKTTNKFSLITICNYDVYQPGPTGKRPAKRPANGPTNDHKQEIENLRTKKNLNKKNNFDLFNEVKTKFSLPDGYDEQFRIWLNYKTELKDFYIPIGMQTFIKKSLKDYPQLSDFANAIENSISKGYKGLFAENRKKEFGTETPNTITANEWKAIND